MFIYMQYHYLLPGEETSSIEDEKENPPKKKKLRR